MAFEYKCNYRKFCGFSLIEVMVTIAIIAVISAIAIPAYRDHMIKSRVAGAIPIMADAVELQINYYNLKNVFGTATQLGYASTDGGAKITNASTLYPYARSFWINNFSCGDGTFYGEVTAQLNGPSLGVTPDIMFSIMIHDRGYRGVTKQCYARTDVGSGSNGAMTTSMISQYLPKNCQTALPNPNDIATICAN